MRITPVAMTAAALTAALGLASCSAEHLARSSGIRGQTSAARVAATVAAAPPREVGADDIPKTTPRSVAAAATPPPAAAAAPAPRAVPAAPTARASVPLPTRATAAAQRVTAPVSAAQPAPAPGSAAQPAPAPVSAAQPAPAPVSAAQPAPAPVSAAQPAPAPVSAAQPAPTPVSAPRPAPSPVRRTEATISPVSPAKPAPAPVGAAGPAPAPVSAPESGRQPGSSPVANPVPDGWRITIGGWARPIVAGSQSAIDSCGPAVLYSSSFPDAGGSAWLNGHNNCGFQFWADLPVGSTLTIANGAAVFRYRVVGHGYVAQQGISSAGLIHNALTLQTCKGPGTSFTYADRI